MYKYIKFEGFLQKQFEEPQTKEYSTGVAVVYDATDDEFQALLALQNNGKEITLEEFQALIKESDQYKHDMSKIQSLFIKKTEGLKEMLADKSNYTKEYIDKQSEIYEYMYQFAKQGVYDEETNAAIIAANEAAKAKAAGFVLLINEVRSKIEKMAKAGQDIDGILRGVEKIDKNTTLDQIKALLA